MIVEEVRRDRIQDRFRPIERHPSTSQSEGEGTAKVLQAKASSIYIETKVGRSHRENGPRRKFGESGI